jgi:hypothetical protein
MRLVLRWHGDMLMWFVGPIQPSKIGPKKPMV